MQVHPGAPGTARQGRTRSIIVSTNDGGNATQPRAPGHERPRAALRAARHGRLSAALRAPGADVPLAITAGAPGQHCLSAAPRAPGHERPLAAQRAAGRDRLSAALRAPGTDVPLATTARAPGQHRLRAAPIATVPSPAGLCRLRQRVLPRVPANPRTLIYPHTRQDTAQNRAKHAHRLNRHSCSPPRHSRFRGNPRPPVATGGPPGGYAPATRLRSHTAPSSLRRKPQSSLQPAAGRRPDSPSLPGKGPGVRSTSHQVHPAIQVPPRPRSCSPAGRGPAERGRRMRCRLAVSCGRGSACTSCRSRTDTARCAPPSPCRRPAAAP